MKKKILFASFLLTSFVYHAQIKILFDATKGEMAGNADWVIDADLHNLSVTSSGTETLGGSDSNPQKVPTPAQSGITSSTSETYWTGALSYWAIDLVKKGFTVETLPYNGKITYGDTTNTQDLSNYKVFIIDEPNIVFSTAEKNALVNFVSNGGGLFMIADHDVSDRNNDGWDSPNIWNDFSTTNTVKTNPFGITFDLKSISPDSTNFAPSSTNTTILAGSAGTPTEMMFSAGTTMTLDKTANPTVKGLVFTNGSSTSGTSNVMFATATYGNGKVCALGDSSVPDDGSGDSGDTLYDGYITDANGNHQKILINAVIWLAQNSALNTNEIPQKEFEFYPNPVVDFVHINNPDQKPLNVSVVDMSGKIVFSAMTKEDKIDLQQLSTGTYYLTVENQSKSRSIKLIKK